jgi:hypothetical protein
MMIVPNPERIRFRQAAWRHQRAGNTASEQRHQLLISRGAPETAREDVGDGDSVAVRAMARRTREEVRLRAALDVGGRVPVLGILRPRRCASERDDQEQHRRKKPDWVRACHM